MFAYLLKIRRNIFPFTLASAASLGISLAYIFSIALLFLFKHPTPIVADSKSSSSSHSIQSGFKLERGEIEGIVVGNLFRGSSITLDDGENKTFSLESLKLIGILAGSPRYARAAIQKKGERQAEAYGIGDDVSGAKVVDIRLVSVTLESSNGSRFELTLGQESDAGGANSSAGSLISSHGSDNSIQKINLSRDRFLQSIKDQKQLFRLKFAPAIEGSKIKGWRLLKVPSDHFFYSVGARSGDIIRRYNGRELENQERMIEMWQSLKTANHITLDMDRGGKTIVFDISIK